jgi:hypothetical protein
MVSEEPISVHCILPDVPLHFISAATSLPASKFYPAVRTRSSRRIEKVAPQSAELSPASGRAVHFEPARDRRTRNQLSAAFNIQPPQIYRCRRIDELWRAPRRILSLQQVEVRRLDELDSAFARAKSQIEAHTVIDEGLFDANTKRIADLR